jgi:type I restriction enzyme, R subunit
LQTQAILQHDSKCICSPEVSTWFWVHYKEQRVKFINIAQHIIKHPAYVDQILNNSDEQNRRLAMEKMISQAVGQERKRELDLYKRYASDPDFKRAFDATIMRILEQKPALKP